VSRTYLLFMKSAKGKMFRNTGVYKDVLKKMIVSTMSFSNEDGKAISGSEAPVVGHFNWIVLMTRPEPHV
jgi:hypothetical protein